MMTKAQWDECAKIVKEFSAAAEEALDRGDRKMAAVYLRSTSRMIEMLAANG